MQARHEDFQLVLRQVIPVLKAHENLATWISTGVVLCVEPCADPLAPTPLSGDVLQQFGYFVAKWNHTFVPLTKWSDWIGQFYVMVSSLGPTTALPTVKPEQKFDCLPSLEQFGFKNSSCTTKQTWKYILQKKTVQEWYDGPITNLFQVMEHNSDTYKRFTQLFVVLKKLNCTYGIKNDDLPKTELLINKVTTVFQEFPQWFSELYGHLCELKGPQYKQQMDTAEVFRQVILNFKKKVTQMLASLIELKKLCLQFQPSEDEQVEEEVVTPAQIATALSQTRLKRKCSKSPRAWEKPNKKAKVIQEVVDDDETEKE